MVEIGVAIITISDRTFRGEMEDQSGPFLSDYISKHGWKVRVTKIISDDFDMIVENLNVFSDQPDIDLILTTGGTGLSPRDNTPEATMRVIEKTIPGLSESIRSEGAKNNPHSILSRGISGICRDTLIINLPGNPKGAIDSLNSIIQVLPHALNQINRKQPDFH